MRNLCPSPAPAPPLFYLSCVGWTQDDTCLPCDELQETLPPSVTPAPSDLEVTPVPATVATPAPLVEETVAPEAVTPAPLLEETVAPEQATEAPAAATGAPEATAAPAGATDSPAAASLAPDMPVISTMAPGTRLMRRSRCFAAGAFYEGCVLCCTTTPQDRLFFTTSGFSNAAERCTLMVGLRVVYVCMRSNVNGVIVKQQDENEYQSSLLFFFARNRTISPCLLV